MSHALLTRRNAISALGLAITGGVVATAGNLRPKRILLRSSWQTVNIGDIAHTPGVLNLLEHHLPDVRVTLWPSRIDNGVDELLMARFPNLTLVQNNNDLKVALDQCDFLLHGSGASLVAQRDVMRWHRETGKPYGIYGVTFPEKKSSSTTPISSDAMRETIRAVSGAEFVFFRDSRSLALAKRLGCTSKVMEFGPDGAFACDLRDDDAADQFLQQNQLAKDKFLCCIPRLRYSPYWTIKDRTAGPGETCSQRADEGA